MCVCARESLVLYNLKIWNFCLFAIWNSIVSWENSHTNEIVFLTANGQHFHNDDWEACVETSLNIRVIRF